MKSKKTSRTNKVTLAAWVDPDLRKRFTELAKDIGLTTQQLLTVVLQDTIDKAAAPLRESAAARERARAKVVRSLSLENRL